MCVNITVKRCEFAARPTISLVSWDETFSLAEWRGTHSLGSSELIGAFQNEADAASFAAEIRAVLETDVR